VRPAQIKRRLLHSQQFLAFQAGPVISYKQAASKKASLLCHC
jgi:hypothetical protein